MSQLALLQVPERIILPQAAQVAATEGTTPAWLEVFDALDPRYRIPSICVLRDRLLELGVAPVPCPVATLDAGALAGEAVLVDLGWRDLLQHMAGVWAPLLLLGRCLQRGDRAALRIDRDMIERGLALHIEGIEVARQLGLPAAGVKSRIIGARGWGRACDVIDLEGVVETIRRPVYRDHEEGTTIRLPAGWQAQKRRTHKAPAWDPPPPGWGIDLRRCRLFDASLGHKVENRRAINHYLRNGQWAEFAAAQRAARGEG